MDDTIEGMDAPEVSGSNGLTEAISNAISDCAQVPGHAIHWVLVADVQFSDGDLELAIMTAPNMPDWMIEAMLNYVHQDSHVHAVDEDDEDE